MNSNLGFNQQVGRFFLSLAFAAAAAVGVSSSAWAGSEASDPTVVPQVDLNRYAGHWFDIAHSPNFFQKKCVHSEATYAVIASDALSVRNTCFESSGKTSGIKGKATVQNPSEPAKLKVVFNIFARGDYWITGLDADYQWALVSGPGKKSIFILARQAPMNPELLSKILTQMKQQGYDTQHLVFDRY